MSVTSFVRFSEFIPVPVLGLEDPSETVIGDTELPQVLDSDDNSDDSSGGDDDKDDDDDPDDDDDLDDFDVEKEVTLDEGFTDFDENDFDDDFDDDFEQDVEDEEFDTGEPFELDE